MHCLIGHKKPYLTEGEFTYRIKKADENPLLMENNGAFDHDIYRRIEKMKIHTGGSLLSTGRDEVSKS